MLPVMFLVIVIIIIISSSSSSSSSIHAIQQYFFNLKLKSDNFETLFKTGPQLCWGCS